MPLDLNDEETKTQFDEAVTKAVESKMDDSFKESVAAAVAEATKELKAKNEELIGEKRRATEKLGEYEDLDVEKLKKYKDQLDNDENAKLIAEGKFQEVIDKATEKVRSNYNDQITDIQRENDELKAIAEMAERRSRQTIVEINLRRAAEVAEVLPAAIDDVIARGASLFTVEDDGNLVQRDSNGELVQIDGKTATPTAWLTQLKEKAPHFWPQSETGGMTGDTGTGMSREEEQLARAAASGDMSKYREIRDRQRKRGQE